ncbi:MAG: J domain-containing protein [Caryophanon sp.]|nr:J domain-containing protein [Caryophanon sp.]
MLLNKNSNYFELLGIDEQTTERDIRVAYNKMLRQYSNEKFPEEFQLITEAYKTLMDEKKRVQYIKETSSGGAYKQNIALLEQYMNEDSFYEAKKIQQQLMLNGFSEDEYVLLCAMHIANELEDATAETKYAQKLAQLHGQSDRTQEQLMYYYSRQANYEKAIYYAEQQHNKQPLDNERILNLVTLYYRNNEERKVDELFQKALRTLEPRMQNIVIFIEALFWGMNNDKDALVRQVEQAFEHIIDSGQKLSLLQRLVDNGAELYNDHYAFKYFTLLVERLNDNEYEFARSWTTNGRNMFQVEVDYYGDEKRVIAPVHDSEPVVQRTYEQPKPASIPEQPAPRTYNVAEKNRGSMLWSIVFGVIACLIEQDAFVGAFVGVIWYFFASKIKKLISCLVIVIIVLLIFSFIIENTM